jgi:endonuclease/exonuclease/phosphatase family metal-dependent hydrolase
VDVACLQEVVFRRRVALLRSLAPGHPHVAHRPFLAVTLGGLVTLSRWPIVAQRFVAYRTRGRWWNAVSDRLIRKGLLLTELDVAGRRLVVINTHLLANYAADWSPGSHYAQLEDRQLSQLADVVDGLDPALPLVVAGDLNVPSGTWLADRFLARTGLRDAFDGRGERTWRPAPADGPQNDIDHVLVRGPVGVSAELCFRDEVRLADGRSVPVSDHLGIAARLDLR